MSQLFMEIMLLIEMESASGSRDEGGEGVRSGDYSRVDSTSFRKALQHSSVK